MQLLPSIQIIDKQPILIAGPCVVENKDICFEIAEKMVTITQKLDIPYIFKASYEKANRTSGKSFRSIGIEESLRILEDVKNTFHVPVISDVHESSQIPMVNDVLDMIQIPAFLCRQTDLLLAAGATQKPVNIKKGQFMAPEDMQFAVGKVASTGNAKSLLTERGTFFGYGNLVVDFRSLPIMKQFAPVIFDVTHSVQLPGAGGGVSSGNRKMAPCLAKAAAAIGVNGFFIETHSNPEEALSDGPNMIPLHEMEDFLRTLKEICSL